LYSATITVYSGFLFFTKTRKLVITSRHLLICSDKNPVKVNDERRRYI
jgi:hypothetical protein